MKTHDLTTPELIAAIAAIPRLDYTPTDLGADHGPDVEYLSPRDSDVAAGKDEDRTWRSWP